MPDTKKVKFINPPNHLKMKVGGGGIPEERIKQAQQLMDTYEVDFRPEAQKLVKNLTKATQAALQNTGSTTEINRDHMVFPIMQLKANGGMFKYQLLTDVADICLQFMESVTDYNKEAIDIIKAHENTIQIILKNDLRGDGGAEGYALIQELHQACKRYFKKYKT